MTENEKIIRVNEYYLKSIKKENVALRKKVRELELSIGRT